MQKWFTFFRQSAPKSATVLQWATYGVSAASLVALSMNMYARVQMTRHMEERLRRREQMDEQLMQDRQTASLSFPRKRE